VILLGIRTVRQLALGFSVLSNFRSGPCEGFEYDDFWSRSLGTGVAAQALATRVKKISADEAFSCGLLCQIGRLGLACVHPQAYAELLKESADPLHKDFIKLEYEQFALDHNQVTSALMLDWGIPETYAEAALYHEDPDHPDLANKPQVKALAQLLNVATKMAAVCMAPAGKRTDFVPALLAHGQELGLNQDSLCSVFDAAVIEWNEMGETLKIATGEVPSLAELIKGAGKLPTPEPVQAPEEAPLEEVQRRSLRILVVDDDATDQAILAKHLTDEGHVVTTASNGGEALQMVMESSPQMIITDWVMSEMDGMELCRTMRRADRTKHIYIIMLTVRDDCDDIVQAFNAGADDFVVKPLNAKILKARVRAGERVVSLQDQIEEDKEEIRRAAADLAIVNRKLKKMALFDNLTQLPNRHYGMNRLHKEWDESTADDKSLVCMIMDIDHFKSVNDTYGHDAGDVVLQATAAAMKGVLDGDDVICRWGGEEFLVICPDLEIPAAAELGDRIRAAVEANQLQTEEFTGGITISIGVAARDRTQTTLSELLKTADEALYAAKEAGRNRVCVVGAKE